jgi:hypothetical protein
MHEFKSYLERARDEINMEDWMSRLTANEVFQYYSMLPNMTPDIYTRIARNMQVSYTNTVKSLIRTIEHLNKIPRIFT